VDAVSAKKISARVRREAIEACLCSAQFHMDPLQHAGVGVFVDGAIDLAWQAVTKVVDRTLWKFRDLSVEGRAAEWEDAAKLLLSGWSP
jgi:hypothetical protein